MHDRRSRSWQSMHDSTHHTPQSRMYGCDESTARVNTYTYASPSPMPPHTQAVCTVPHHSGVHFLLNFCYCSPFENRYMYCKLFSFTCTFTLTFKCMMGMQLSHGLRLVSSLATPPDIRTAALWESSAAASDASQIPKRHPPSARPSSAAAATNPTRHHLPPHLPPHLRSAAARTIAATALSAAAENASTPPRCQRTLYAPHRRAAYLKRRSKRSVVTIRTVCAAAAAASRRAQTFSRRARTRRVAARARSAARRTSRCAAAASALLSKSPQGAAAPQTATAACLHLHRHLLRNAAPSTNRCAVEMDASLSRKLADHCARRKATAARLHLRHRTSAALRRILCAAAPLALHGSKQ